MELIAQKREIFGKKVKALRKQGLIPAELWSRRRKYSSERPHERIFKGF